jgi:hypothetical protein
MHPYNPTIKDKEMLFAILIFMILVASASIWYGHVTSVILFMLTAVCIATVLVVDIDTPLHLAF